MLRLLGLAISVGIADSLNPTTIGPALYLAAGARGRRQVTEFTLAVFAVYFLGGALIAIGPGQLLISLIPHPRHRVQEIIEVAVGAALLAGAAILWRNRRTLARRDPPEVPTTGRSSALLGASITAVELPTAFPYFAVLAALIGSGLGPIRQVALLLVFNVCFILPLLAIVVILTVAGDGAQRLLTRGRDFLNDNWPQVLAALLFLAGTFVLLLGATGLAASGHGRFHHLARQLRHILHP